MARCGDISAVPEPAMHVYSETEFLVTRALLLGSGHCAHTHTHTHIVEDEVSKKITLHAPSPTLNSD